MKHTLCLMFTNDGIRVLHVFDVGHLVCCQSGDVPPRFSNIWLECHIDSCVSVPSWAASGRCVLPKGTRSDTHFQTVSGLYCGPGSAKVTSLCLLLRRPPAQCRALFSRPAAKTQSWPQTGVFLWSSLFCCWGSSTCSSTCLLSRKEPCWNRPSLTRAPTWTSFLKRTEQIGLDWVRLGLAQLFYHVLLCK